MYKNVECDHKIRVITSMYYKIASSSQHNCLSLLLLHWLGPRGALPVSQEPDEVPVFGLWSSNLSLATAIPESPPFSKVISSWNNSKVDGMRVTSGIISFEGH